MDNKTLLIIDDDDVDAESVMRAVKRQNLPFQTLTANDGIDALAILKNSLQQKMVVAPLILLDINMPRMNGHEFLNCLRADPAFSSCVVFVLSTSTNTADQLAAYKKNVAGYLVKSEMGDRYEKLSSFLEKYHETVVIPALN